MDKHYQAVPKSLKELTLTESINDLIPSFDTMMHMAKHEPEKLEALRQNLSDRIIASAPARSRRRLEGLQFEIDMERRRSQSALGSCIRISQMMNESLCKLYDALDAAMNGEAIQPEQPLADVLVFPGR